MELTSKVKPPLDESFLPAVLANQDFQRNVMPVGVRAVIGLERSGGEIVIDPHIVFVQARIITGSLDKQRR